MENVHRSNEGENKFVEFFRGLDESYQRYLIEEMKKKPPDKKNVTAADTAESEGDPKSR